MTVRRKRYAYRGGPSMPIQVVAEQSWVPAEDDAVGDPGLAEQGVEGRRRGAGNESLGPREHHARDQLDLEGRPLDQGREVFDGPREDLRRLIRENATRAGDAGDRVNPQAGRRGGRPSG